MADYEARRQAKIKHNEALLAQLDIKPIISTTRSHARSTDARPLKKRRVFEESTPSRVSARIAAAPTKPNYDEDDSTRNVSLPRSRPSKRPNTTAKTLTRSPSPPPLIPTQDIASIQAGWTSWTPTALPPTRDPTTQTFHFSTHPDFTPNKSPAEMLREGAFGGSYYRPLRSRKLGITITDDWRELPTDWLRDLKVELFLINPEYDPDVNKFKVACGQSIEEWEAAGWIDHAHDVRGWFQWYTRFFQGRRCEDDERQVSRWRKCVGETGRWRRILLKKYMQLGVREVFDDGAEEDGPEVSPVMHQTCHHWAFEVRQEHLDAFWASGGK